MTLKELLEKNARIRAERELAKKLQEKVNKAEIQPAPAVQEESPHAEEIIAEEEPKIIESEKEEPIEEEKKEEEKKPVSNNKKGNKKPSNRAYMVVEDIDKVNE